MVTPDGESVRHAAVRLFGPHAGSKPPWLSGDAGITPAVTVQTDETGAFRAENLAPGKWWFQREAKGYFEHEEYDATKSERFHVEWLYVTATIPEKTQGDQQPATVPSVTLVMRKTAYLYGRILGTDGRPVTRQAVWLVSPLFAGCFLPQHCRVAVDANGFYELECPGFVAGASFNSKPAQVETEERDDYLPTHQFGLYVPSRPGYGPYHSFLLEDGKRTRLDFQLVRGASVSGTIYADNGKTPVAGAKIDLHARKKNGLSMPFDVRGPSKENPGSDPRETLTVQWQGATVTSDAQGHYEAMVEPGIDTTLSVRKSDLAATKEKTVRLNDGQHLTGTDFIVK